MRKTDFTKALTEYFSIYLPTTCGVSPNTTNSYRDTFKQLLLFFQEKKGISANYIELRYLNMELVSEFLDWLETSRHIAVTTRNQRLAAIKAFAHFVQYKFPENIENCVDIINLRPKKYEKALIPFLTEDDLSLLLSQPDASTRQGLRDLTLLALLYDSGARVQELVDLRLKDVRLTHPIMRSTYGAAMTVTFMNAWNSYLWPKIIFQSNASITMPMLVANLKSGYSVDYGMLMLGVLICTLPTAIIFLCLQKSFANGITGAVK